MTLHEEKKRVLVIEDNEINRELLVSILEDSYETLEASNGQDGLQYVKQYGTRISVILLDIQMPVMNGYDFLNAFSDKTKYPNIPVIVATSADSLDDEIQCLEMGASDFISKPYNPRIILLRVASLIRLHETTNMLNKVEYDKLTGLYAREFFFDHVSRFLLANSDQEFDMICSDIDSFKLVNERYGERKGDQLLHFVAGKLKELLPKPAVYGRIGGDLFAVLCPHYEYEQHVSNVERFTELMKSAPVKNVDVYFGVYCNISKTLPISVICDNALLAIENKKHNYNVKIAAYDDSVRQKMHREQTILDIMGTALEQHEFQVYFQPKHDLVKDKTGGAEALVRWINPELGFMNPGEFIPLFEKNGFIGNLDSYILEENCRIIRQWLDEGKTPVPISVNVSRADFEQADLVTKIRELTEKYHVPREYIHLEVTESAYIDNPGIISDAVKQLKEEGFSIELDDFGSGFSSLSTVVELSPDILKLDMSIIRNILNENQRTVITHIISMAKDLNMKTVAEGVETEEQKEILKKLGCDYIQGYFYSKPLPQKDFEAYLWG